MNCERIQELILTDYLDGELSIQTRQSVQKHIQQCDHCREFLNAAKKTTVNVFEILKQKQLPEQVWENIEYTLINQAVVGSASHQNWIEYLKGLLFSFRSAVIVTAMIVFCLVAGTFNQFKNQQAMVKPKQSVMNENTGNNQKSIDFLVSVIDSNSAVSTAEFSDLGTAVEQYFL